MSGELSGRFFSFDCESVPLEPGTMADPRPADRPREAPDAVFTPPAFYSFDCESVPLEPGTMADPRPAGRPREAPDVPAAESDEAFARELVDRVLAYVQSRPSGLSAEQLAALVQQLLTRRSA
jgi:hypothetical protein